MAGKLSGAITAQDFPTSSPVNDPIKTPKLAGAKDYRDYSEFSDEITSSIPRQQFVGSTGIGESQFDTNIPISQLDRLGQIRADRQPWTHQAGNAILGGVTSGVLTAIEDVGYILDLPNNFKSSTLLDFVGARTENVESNWLSDWAKDNKEAVNAALPIYRKDPTDTFDWNDSGFYFDMLKGALDSAVGFGLVGMGASGAIKALGAGTRALSRLGDINRVTGYLNNVVAKGLQSGTLGNVGAAYITNFGESKMMALELYNDVNNQVLDELVQQHQDIYGIAPEGDTLKQLQLKASDIAGKEANTFMLQNKMFMLTDYMQLGSIFKTPSLARDLMSKPGLKTFAKTQLKTAPKEALEEIGQNVLQMEGKYQAQQRLKDEFGIEVDEAISQENDWINRVIEFATSDQALLEGMMGLISGPIQYAVTTAPFQDTKGQNQRYVNQQATIRANKEFFENKANIVASKTKALEEAIANNQLGVAELMTNSQFQLLAIENFQRGTTEQLETVMREQLESPDNTKEEKKSIQTKLDELLSLEEQYNTTYKKYANAGGVFQNRLVRDNLTTALDIVTKQKDTLVDNINKEFGVLLDQHNQTQEGRTNPVSVSQILDILDNSKQEEFKALPKNIRQAINSSVNIQNYGETTKALVPALQASLVATDKTYNDMVSSRYSTAYNQMQEIMSNTKTTEDKVKDLGKLLDRTENLKNETLKRQIESQRSQLLETVNKAKEANAAAQKDPDTSAAEVNKKTPKAKTETTTNKVKETPNVIPGTQQADPNVVTTPTITPEQKEQVELIKAARLMQARANNDTAEVQAIQAVTDEELLQAIQDDPSILEDAQAGLDEWANLTPEQQENIIKNSVPVTELFEEEIADEVLPTEDSIAPDELFSEEVPQEIIPAVEETPVKEKTISYTPKGKEKQTYTIRGSQIFNSKGEEVFKGDSVDRNKIFANLAVKEGRADIITHKDAQYIVNKKGDIISVKTGKKMQWAENNGDRQAILSKSKVYTNNLAKEEININESPKSPEVEVRNYNSETSTVNKDLAQNDGQAEVKNSEVDVKLTTPPRTEAYAKFYEWLENGVNPKGEAVTFTRNNYRGDDKANRAQDTFDVLKRGEEVSDADYDNMVDNLPILMSVDKAGVSAFLFTVRDTSKENKDAVKQERKLRTQIINNLLQDIPATSVITGQYGGDLKVTEEDVSIVDIPDFKNGKVDDIPLMYVNGEGYLYDVTTRELTSNTKFQGTKVLLKSTGNPMAGAIFTMVRKANGDLFPLKLNITDLSNTERDLIVKMLQQIITPNAERQGNILNTKLPEDLLDMLSLADRQYLSEGGKKSITYAMALNHLVYEGERTKSADGNGNAVTQFYFKNGKIIFGDDEITLSNFPQKIEKLKEFLLKYKTRNIDLRKLNNDITYKRHVINNGLLTTNTDVKGDTLFEGANLKELYPGNKPENIKERTENRYKSATIYVKPELDTIAPPKAKTTTTVKDKTPILESTPEIPNITGKLEVNPIQQVSQAKLEENKETMQLPNISGPQKLSRSVRQKGSDAIKKKTEEITKKNDKNKSCD
jgi:hypothetical protein